MSTKIDPAAVFAIASSISSEADRRHEFEIVETFYGYDQFMRQCMFIAESFELWAIEHVDFDQLTDVWPYLLEENFGDALFNLFHLEDLLSWRNDSCLKVALKLRLPIVRS